MARIPYADLSNPATHNIVERIVAERGSVLHLYQMLLHSLPLAEGWLTYLTAIRQKLEIKGSIREMVIIRVALINGAEYEAEQHTPVAVKEGMSLEQVMALASWEKSELFDDDEKAVLALTDEMTLHVQVRKDTFERVLGKYGQSTTVELIATIAAYNMVSRVIEALEISVKDAREL
jgi:AhpD family alkylhydroperoxidase